MGIAKRAAGYVRISQVGGRAGDSFHSPEIQRERIEAWAAYRGFTVSDWYVDLDRPAKEGDPRPELERLMGDAAAGRFEMVAVFRLSRFARSVADAARRYGELRKLGVGLASVTEDIDTSTASGELIQNILFAMADFESKRIGEEWQAVHAARRRRGIAHVTKGMFGYEVGNGTLGAVIPEEADAVRTVYAQRLGGASYRELSDLLERSGQRPRGGGPRFGKTAIQDMLANPLYAGLVRLGDELLPAKHDPVVTPDQWRAVNALRIRSNATGRFKAGLLSGLVFCASCGYRMAHDSSGETLRPRYRCAGRHRSRGCPRPTTIVRDPLDEHVEARMLARIDPKLMPHGGRIKASRGASHKRRAQEAQRRVEELNRALDSLADQRYVAGTLEAAEHERQQGRLLAQREEERGVAEEATARAATRPAMTDALSVYRNADLRGKQKLIRTQVERVTVRPYEKGMDLPDRLEIEWV